jgi:hypothetical protein
MTIYSGEQLVLAVRSLCDTAKTRIWIASPYIGDWDGVRCVLGLKWWNLPKDNVRLLTDAEMGDINRNMIDNFRAKGPVKHLLGLHAKIYIVDDEVILSSANLTRAAFSCRHEVGVRLNKSQSQIVIKTFQGWWDNLAKPITTAQLAVAGMKRGTNAGEASGKGLPKLWDLPPDPGEFGVDKMFGDYEPFRSSYALLAHEYRKHKRAWPDIPLYLEIDGFLDYLFNHDGKPSHPYSKAAPQILTPAEQRKETSKYAKVFRTWALSNGKDTWRLQRASQLKCLLTKEKLHTLSSKKKIDAVLRRLFCMNDARVRNRILERNTPRTISKAWGNLLYGNAPLPQRMSECAHAICGFKRSGVQELLGWFDPEHCPIRNGNTNAGMRFLGYDVTAK